MVIALMVGAPAYFATPIGYRTNGRVYPAGDYPFTDFVRIGVPIDIVMGLAVCTTRMMLGWISRTSGGTSHSQSIPSGPMRARAAAPQQHHQQG